MHLFKKKKRKKEGKKRNVNRVDEMLKCTRQHTHSLKGHLGCKKCYYENILQQKKEAERLQEAYEQQLAQLAV